MSEDQAFRLAVLLQAFRLEEYRHLSAAILDIDGRIITVFGLSLAAAGTLLGIAASAVFTDAGPAGQAAPLALAFWSLAPAFLVGAAFWMQLHLRRDMVRLGMYRKVFFEQDGVPGLRWESALAQFRLVFRGETNDPIPVAYWLVLLASGVLFWTAAERAGAGLVAWTAAGVPPLGLAWLHRQWLRVVRVDLTRMEQEWQRVKATPRC